jgi:hypothetical protein
LVFVIANVSYVSACYGFFFVNLLLLLMLLGASEDGDQFVTDIHGERKGGQFFASEAHTKIL